MSESGKPDLSDGPAFGGEEAALDKGVSDVTDDLTAAIELLEPGKPFVLNDGFLVTDGGSLIVSQYVDIGVEKRRQRPRTVLKFIEAEHGLEHVPEIQLSAPHRFRDYGETFIQDDQEGNARREKKVERPPRSYEEETGEQERALSLLGIDGMTVTHTESPHVDRETESMTFGRNSWIYCTAMGTALKEWDAKREKLSDKYDHVSAIRQPRKFALALGEMFANQQGAKGKRGHVSHQGGTMSFHDNQFVMHGPVWYTDDVLGFLESRRSEPLYLFYPLFLKHSQYRDQEEYRFVLHCESPVESETLRLNTSGAMRDALAPPLAGGKVTYQRPEDSDGVSSRTKVTGPRPTHRTSTRTGNWSNRRTRTLKIGGKVAQEEIITSERNIVLTTELPVDGVELAESALDAPVSGEGAVTDSDTRERWVAGKLTDLEISWSNRLFTITDTSDSERLFTIEEQDKAAEMLKAVGRPFENFSALPKQASDALKSLAVQTALVEPDLKMRTMSACWNSIWAICNLCECYGDIVESVGIKEDEFVVITLKQTADAGADGKVLVGPTGTFAYVLMRDDEKLPGHGGTKDGLVFFPDEEARSAFEKFGWTTLRKEDPE